MTRKRFVKLLMSMRIQRNEANLFALLVHQYRRTVTSDGQVSQNARM